MPTAVLLGYDPRQPSFRHRMRSIVEPLRAGGFEVVLERLPAGHYGVRIWERRALLRAADVVVLHQIKFSGWEAALFRRFARRSVFDVDDAIYVRKPRKLGEPAGDSRWRRRKFAATCRAVDVVGAGNEVLAGVARMTAREIVILPTSIDTTRYQRPLVGATDAPTIAWIGSPENLVYLEMIRPALANLTRRHPALKLRVICSRFPQWPEINIEPVTWSSETEARALAGAHVGVMPLSDDEWSRGKCAFKLLQYMAAWLPCVASPIGANIEVVRHGYNGFHARDAVEWETLLGRLIDSTELRTQMGEAGHAHVEAHYSMQTYGERYAALLSRLAAPGARPGAPASPASPASRGGH